MNVRRPADVPICFLFFFSLAMRELYILLGKKMTFMMIFREFKHQVCGKRQIQVRISQNRK